MTLTVSDIVRNGAIDISPELWRDMQRSLSRARIQQLISTAIDAYRISPPIRDLTLDDARAGFDALCELDTARLIRRGPWFARYQTGYMLKSKTRTYLELSYVGAAASNYFHQLSRWRAASASPSPLSVWSTERLRRSTLQALFSLKVDRVNTATLRSIIRLRKYVAAQFPPAAAKAIYDYFAPQRVLDFSMGWGDRFAGFSASQPTRYYLGIDPNTSLRDGYERQVRLYNAGKGVGLIAAAAEDVDLTGERPFDLAFTSPPYYSTEKYSDDLGQSFTRYRSVDAWLSDFLFVALRRAYDSLRPGGWLIINIADVLSRGRVLRLCDPMNEFLASLGATYWDCWGLQLPPRVNSEADARRTSPQSGERRGAFCEPIWIWHKTSAAIVRDRDARVLPYTRIGI